MKAVMYHYVRPFDSSYPNFKNLHIEDFQKQLDYFEAEYGFVKREDFLSSFEKKELPKGVVLTFDDGLSCHYDFVFPELKKRNLWGIFYIPTFPYTNQKILDVHRTHLLLGKYNANDLYSYLTSIVNDSMIDKSKVDEFKKFTYNTQINDEYTLIFKRMTNYFIDYKYRERVMDELMKYFFPNENELINSFYVSENQIKEMHEGGMIIGSHTVNHPVMSRLNELDQRQEIENSFEFLEDIIQNNEFKTFCYPYGGFHSFNDLTEKILSENNCQCSFNVEHRDINSNDLINRKQALPRYDCNYFKHGQVRNFN
ncbi:polysaccharide deacetylase family protein [Flavobacterium sp.]|jgi:peptidoglycan/xylan/chitin deacetylase (PgdA/CDA1 family)|uniref:polysaccharide deacetylase family protein n=1 Tax=Flavobacterium sp. TaxID=239 RepID=UPI0037BF75D9